MKIMAILAIVASLFGCGKHDPYILDGPGMVYVDSDYRTEYANCLPFENIQGSPYLAIAYLGKGEDGKANKDVYITKIFESLDSEKISQIKTFEFEGEDWFLVIPKYRNLVSLIKRQCRNCFCRRRQRFAIYRRYRSEISFYACRRYKRYHKLTD